MKGYPNWFGTGAWFAAGGGGGKIPVAFSNLGGISGYAIPSLWASGSLAIVPNQAWDIAGNPWLSGTVDLVPIWQWCASQGFMSMSETIYGYEFGVEYGAVGQATSPSTASASPSVKAYTVTLPLPANWTAGQQYTCTWENNVEAAINALGAGTRRIPAARLPDDPMHRYQGNCDASPLYGLGPKVCAPGESATL